MRHSLPDSLKRIGLARKLLACDQNDVRLQKLIDAKRRELVKLLLQQQDVSKTRAALLQERHILYELAKASAKSKARRDGAGSTVPAVPPEGEGAGPA